jgi:CBS domain-containing protein
MSCNYYILEYDEICTLDINSSASTVGHIFTTNHHETVFVIDSEKHLHGIITMGDFFRKAIAAKSIEDLLNKDYKRIDIGLSENADRSGVEKAAFKIFINIPGIKRIPVIGGGKLLYVLSKEKKGELWDSLREDIIRRFLHETALHRNV